MNPIPHTRKSPVQHQSGAMSQQALTLLLGVVVIALIAIYFLFVRAPAAPIESAIVAPVTTPEERGDSARDLIEQIRTDPAGVDFAEAHEQAGQYQSEGRLADAQLLYFFAARGNYAPAAFDLATMYDPNHFSSDTSLMDKPSPSQAYKWYQVARDGGSTSAPARLEELKAWVENAASEGDMEAEQLLLRWE